MGSSIPGMTKAAPRRFRIPSVNVRYLNTNRIPRFTGQGGHKRGRAGSSRSLAGIHPQAEAVIGQDGAQHDQYKPGLPPGIEAREASSRNTFCPCRHLRRAGNTPAGPPGGTGRETECLAHGRF